MKTILAVAATALITASGTVAGGQFVDHGARAQIKQLKKSVRALNLRVQDGEIFDACMKDVYGVTQYPGYVGFDGTNYYTTTGLDGSSTPQVWLQAVDAVCVGSGQSMFHVLKTRASRHG